MPCLLARDQFDCRYDTVKAFMQRKYKVRDGLPLHVVSSTVAGIVATSQLVVRNTALCFAYTLTLAHAIVAVCSPADVIKSRVMHSSEVFSLLSSI